MLAMTCDTIYLLAPKKMTTGQIHLLSGAKTGEKKQMWRPSDKIAEMYACRITALLINDNRIKV